MIKYIIELLDLLIAFVSCFGKYVVYNFSERSYYVPTILPDRLNTESTHSYCKQEPENRGLLSFIDTYLMTDNEIISQARGNIIVRYRGLCRDHDERRIVRLAKEIKEENNYTKWHKTDTFVDGSMIGDRGASSYFLNPITKKAISRGFHSFFTANGMLIGKIGASTYRLHPITKKVMYEVRTY